MNRISLFAVLTILLVTGLVTARHCSAQENPKTGTINGTVIDVITKAPLIGASVTVLGTQMGAAANTEGEFAIADVPVGSYTLQIQSIGYSPQAKTDVIVRPSRITSVDAELQLAAVEVDDVVVTAGYFTEPDDQPTSIAGYTAEEIRRAPGSAGDVSRIMMSLPSVAVVNDQFNSLIVRGGNPTENAFYIDNIEVPNINHYPVQGSSGGPIGLLNNDFIQDVTFSAGGFPVAYGDRLSSVMDLTFREGNRDELDGQVDLHFAGFGLAAEGPVGNRRGSWMASVRRSFLDLLVDAIGTGVAPRYSDYQGKLSYNLSSQHKLTAIGVLGIDFIELTKEDSEDEGNIVYGQHDGYEYAGGVNWRYLWGTNGYSNTSLSMLGTKVKGNFFETKSDYQLSDENSLEQVVQLRNANYYRFNERHRIDVGFDVKYLLNDLDYFTGEYTNALGDTVPPRIVDDYVNTPKAGVYVSHTWRLFPRLTTTLGLRYDYFDYNGHDHLAARGSFAYDLSSRTSLNGAVGSYYQFLPLLLLAQQEGNKKLRDPEAVHYVLGINHLLSESTKLTLEGYFKNYRHFPVDPAQPQFFIGDILAYGYYLGNYEELRDDGRARAYGLELTVRKKLVQGMYGLLSGAYSVSEYQALDGIWRNRIFDNQYIFSVEGGYKPNNRWEFSLRWIFAGGVPYTPLDLKASQAINRSVFDPQRVNQERYPDYHSLNLRVDRRFHFGKSNLIVYFSVWNAYNRENVAQYYWNEIEQQQDTLYQWSLLPVFGLEFEF